MLLDQTSETLTCLAESAGDTYLWNGTEIACRLYRDMQTDILYFAFDWANEETETLATNHFRVTYNGETKGFDTIAGFSSPVCVLTYAEDVHSLRFRLMAEDDELTVNGRAIREKTFSFAWLDFSPVLYWNGLLYANYVNRVSWTMEVPDGYMGTPRTTTLYLRRQDEETYTAFQTVTLCFDNTGWGIQLTAEELGASYYYDVEYVVQETEDGKPMSRNRIITQTMTVERDGGNPFPVILSVGAVTVGSRVRIKWSCPEDPLYTLQYFDLYRAVEEDKTAEPSWTLLYSGTSMHFTDVPPEMEYVRYRVRGRASGRIETEWTDSGWLRQAISNLYVGVSGKPVPVLSVQIGEKIALPYGYIG